MKNTERNSSKDIDTATVEPKKKKKSAARNGKKNPETGAGASKKQKKLSKSTALPEINNVAKQGYQPPEKAIVKLKKFVYEKELAGLQMELVKLQYWVKHAGLRIVIIFEGRDAAGKGSTIKRIVDCLNPRGCRVVALGTPSDHEKTQWYFQRYVAHLPGAGEIVLFDRSWYNRAGVERVMDFCTEEQYREFLQSCPEFERMLVRSGIILLKYWFSVSDDEQERRFQARMLDPTKRWKLSPMDLESRNRWVEYSKAKDEMFAHTNIPEAPWFTVEADDKKRSRLNCIHHILSKIPYEDTTPEPFELPPRKPSETYIRPPHNEQFFVPPVY
ncbi:polyphosphate kinase 2 [Pantanalinema sp. GBBB05]|uniref:polyphosphate kinase 2 n=1 Tax=Pantanalinema sp. GBBB05 TaxID=2604139 RepID=UPI001E09A167|nr:polyphosphate kinase 2 [Pantanalinema sp. GBBB05]